MPNPRTNPRYTQRNVSDGYRRCTRSGNVYPATPEYFYARTNGRLELCQGTATEGCRQAYFRNYAADRAAAATAAITGATTTATGRRFGVEVEFIGNAAAVARAVEAAGYRCEVARYGHTVTPDRWRIVPDGSVPNGSELVSPPLIGEAGRAEVVKVLRAAVEAGATVDRTCGLHVHHEVPEFDAPRLARLLRVWANAQGATDALVAPSRRDGRWCHHLPPRMVEAAAEYARQGLPWTPAHAARAITGGERYLALNVDCLPRYGTVEVRQHQGTTNGVKVTAWTEYGQAVIAYALTTAPAPVDGVALADWLRMLVDGGHLAPVTAEYLADRAAALDLDHTPRPVEVTPCECGDPECTVTADRAAARGW